MGLLPTNLIAGNTGHISHSNQAYSKLNKAIDVVADFGADPTGVADSYTAINNALASTNAAGGIVFFPPGIYDVGTTIDLTSTPRVTLSGVTPGIHSSTNGSTLRTRNSAMTLMKVGNGTLIHEGPNIEGLHFVAKAGQSGYTMLDIDTVNRWRVRRCAFESNNADTGTGIHITHSNDNAWWLMEQNKIQDFHTGIDMEHTYGGVIIGGEILCGSYSHASDQTGIRLNSTGTGNGVNQVMTYGIFFDGGHYHIKGRATKCSFMDCKFEKPGVAVSLTGASKANWITGHLPGNGLDNDGIELGASCQVNRWHISFENNGTGTPVSNSGTFNFGDYDEYHGLHHYGASTPTGGVSGSIAVGNSKIWVNDAGTWKSVAVA